MASLSNQETQHHVFLSEDTIRNFLKQLGMPEAFCLLSMTSRFIFHHLFISWSDACAAAQGHSPSRSETAEHLAKSRWKTQPAAK